MSVLGSVKDAMVGKALQLMGDPRVSKMMSDPRLMSAAMKAMSLGGSVKAELDKAGRLAAGVLGLATQDQVSALRDTIRNLEDTVAVLESKAAKPAAPARPEKPGNGKQAT